VQRILHEKAFSRAPRQSRGAIIADPVRLRRRYDAPSSGDSLPDHHRGSRRALVVARASAWSILEPALDELGIEYHWETTGAAAARVCSERRFEVALIDVGIRNPEAALRALALRGRRRQRVVILFSDGSAPTPLAIVKQGTPVVAVKDAPQAVLAALRGRPSTSELVSDGAQD
jgi:hypothetical protein